MHLYRVVGGPVSFAAGEVLSLDDGQFALRRAFVKPIGLADGKPMKDGDERIPVRLTEPQQFKAGEVIGIESTLTRYLLEHVVSATEDPAAIAGSEGAVGAVVAMPPKKPGGRASPPTKPVASMLPAGDQSKSRHARPAK